jgi:hypothetical protein
MQPGKVEVKKEAKRVVLLNSFLKKDSKQYKQEIERARTIIEKEELI